VKHPFFKNYGPFNLSDLLKDNKSNFLENLDDPIINDVKDLDSANTGDITFLHSKKYLSQSQKTKASYCITLENLKNYLPKNCKPICVDNVLLAISKVTSKFYPDSINDDFDNSVKKIEELKIYKSVKHGYNVLVGKNVISPIFAE